MNIVPKLEDILSPDITNQYLRKNLKNGAYQSVQHYLDVQFRLLREDFLCPLREGVQKIREIVNEARLAQKMNSDMLSKDIMRRICKIESLSAYFDCSIEVTLPTEQGMVYQVRLNPDRAKSINWDASKKLLFGSLICMSDDLFQKTCLIGCICERDTKKLRDGVLWVKFNIDFENQLEQNIKFGRNFTLIETSAYFESYKYVLQALVSFQRDGEENFPFKENIIYCQNRSMPMPKYLTNMPIDFRPLVDQNKSLNLEIGSSGKEYKYTFSDSSDYAKECYLSNQASWPTAEQMGLDESQYNAVRLALENKLALIQGPPGTGKTFIGVKLVELLLHNKNTWWNRAERRRCPILMICYTNHALDQFLEYCIDQCKLTRGVVRVGGQSKSEKLENFKLSKIKFTMRRSGLFNDNISYRLNEEYRLLETNKTRLENRSISLWKVLSGQVILRLSVLKDYMSINHNDQFYIMCELGGYQYLDREYDYSDICLLRWLGFLEKDFPNINNINIKNSENKVLNKENFNQKNDENSFDQTNVDKCEELNEDENEERMLEEDTKGRINMERTFAKINLNHYQEIITCEQIEQMRNEFLKGEDDDNDETSWRKVQNKNEKKNERLNSGSKGYLRKMYGQKNSESHNESIYQESNINKLKYSERFELYWSWVEKYKVDKQQELDRLSCQYNQQAQIVQELRLQEDRQIFQDAYIVAMTTTGSSRYHSVLKDIGPRIVIVEEAAEVFESHIVASLSKNCEHLILIGDHVQLRPSPTVYKLAKDFNFDVSLFERLINNDVKKVTLTSQHRMRPEICQLMKNFYDVAIEDHESVNGRDRIVGLGNNIFFITHNALEDRQNDDEASITKINRHEAEYAVKLADYLLKQGQFQPEQITILAMYLGQMSEIRKLMSRFGLNKVKCTTVDNYQGEENEIIILSLVRSNHENKIGFLNVKNRVCVALSRARCGLYVIGNFDFISKHETGNTWKEIIKIADNIGAFGNELKVSCGLHPENDLKIRKPSDFDSRTDGGCHLPCDTRLKCGHQCSLRCHPFDREHKKYKCPKRCEKEMKCGHVCQETCSHDGECDKCSISVKKQVPGCGHEIRMRCDQKPKRTDCKKPCEQTLACSHKCLRSCGDYPCGKCLVPYDIELACRHGGVKTVYCHERENTLLNIEKECVKPCGAQLECGHICTSSCANCLGGYIHKVCNQKSDDILFCGHKCTSSCSNMRPPCTSSCKNYCPHSECKLKCSEPCLACLLPCRYKCEHFECTKTCGELCDRPPCNKPCPKSLHCKHACIGFCGEPCPPLCIICNKKEVNRIVFGEDESNWVCLDEETRFVWLDDCGHCIEAKAMDHWMASRYGSIKNALIQLPICPRCKIPIRHNLRYSNYVKTQLALIEKIKLKYNRNEIIDSKRVKWLIYYKLPLVYKSNPKLLTKIKVDILNKFQQYDKSYNELVTFRSLLIIFLQFGKLLEKIKNECDQKRIEFEKKNIRVKNFISNLFGYLLADFDSMENGENIIYTRQHIEEILNQLERIEMIVNYYIFKNEFKNEVQKVDSQKKSKIEMLLSQIDNDLIGKFNPYKGVIKKRVEEKFEELQSYFKVYLTKKEKPVMVEPIVMKKCPWYTCPNGHVYPNGYSCHCM